MTTLAPPPAPTGSPAPSVVQKGLKLGALGLLSTIVIGVASTAPAYSLAATLGFISQGVGVKAPIIVLLAFVPMLFISYAYKALNNADPDCGTSFTWVARAFGRYSGWITGWVIVAADVIVMANLAQIAGAYSFNLVGAHGLENNTTAQMIAGSIWILLMTWISWVGIELSARTQVILLSLELLVLVVFSVVALSKVYAGHVIGSLHVHASWFNPFSGFTPATLAAGMLLAVFIYWGWDSAVTVNEETRDTKVTPGRAAVISTVILLVIYLLVTVAAQAYGGVGTHGLGLSNPDTQDDVLSGLGAAVMGSWGVKLLLLAVLSSAAASTQTTILPTARTTLSMAAYKALPKVFGDVHPRYKTPTVSTWAMGAVSIAFYVGLTLIQPDALGDLIASIGLLIAFYYGLTGFASVVYFWREIWTDKRAFFQKGLMPFLGGVILFGALVYAIHTYYAPDYGNTSFHGIGGVFLLGVGSVAIGVILMIVWRFVAPAYFKGGTMDSHTAISETGEVVQTGK